jgi:hypothetical protein
MMDARFIANISYLVDGVAFKGYRRREVDENSRVREEAGTRDQAYFQMKPAATARGEQEGKVENGTSAKEVAAHEKLPSPMSLRAFVLTSVSSPTTMSSRCGGGPAREPEECFYHSYACQ